MAREVETRLIDDLDGGDADETVTFGLDGHTYEIDLSAKNASKLRTLLATYVDNAEHVRAARGTKARSRTTSADREQNQAIREWAIRKGLDVAPRGRIAQTIIEQYHSRPARRRAAA
jgi:hypothetical protein